MIEGMPRSGNTFARHAFDLAQAAPLVVSSHVHTPSAVVAAVRCDIPTLVLVRRPLDTVISLVIAAPHVTLDAAVDEWIHHYEVLWPLRDSFVVATFDEVTEDFGAVTERLNRRFGTSFDRFQPTEENIAAVFASIEAEHLEVHGRTEHAIPRPSAARKGPREALLAAADGPELAPAWARADALYERYLTLVPV